MPLDDQEVIGGVDTHKDMHAAAALGANGRLLGTALFPTTSAGFSQLLRWLRNYGRLIRVGIEGTGSYGAGLMRYLRSAGVSVVEVNRPNRQLRRHRGKSDSVDAEAAARAAYSGTSNGNAQESGWLGRVNPCATDRPSVRHEGSDTNGTSDESHRRISTAMLA